MAKTQSSAATIEVVNPLRELTAEQLRAVLRYDETTGLFTRLTARGPQSAGALAGGFTDQGYRRVMVFRRPYRAHRLVWLYVHGVWPTGEIDHINGDRADNRLVNLRQATHRQNGANVKRPSHNTSGYKGVSWNKRLGRWQAYIKNRQKRYHLGYFDDVELAHAAYVAAATATFGTFARAA